VHAHLFERSLATRQTVANVTYVVHTIYSCLEIKNARNLMRHLHEDAKISNAEYRAWKRKQIRIE
jgi:hypothetical protein